MWRRGVGPRTVHFVAKKEICQHNSLRLSYKTCRITEEVLVGHFPGCPLILKQKVYHYLTIYFSPIVKKKTLKVL